MYSLVVLVSLMYIGLTAGQYYGEFVGDLSELAHGVSGKVYIVDSNRLRITNFNYDGKGPDAFFWVGTSGSPDRNGMIVPDENGSTGVIKGYMNADIVITLPGGMTVSDIKWLSVWCRQFTVNFGSVMFPGSTNCVPAPSDLGPMTGRTHGVSSGNVRVIDARTVHIEGFNYDGLGPDAFFIAGSGDIKSDNGVKVSEKLSKAENKKIELTLPATHSVRDIEWISAYCIQAASNFGEIRITANLCVPPSLMAEQKMGNCAQMNDDFNVGWTVDGSDIIFEFTGALDDTGYMAFGLSGSDSSSSMVNGDVIIAYLENGMPKVDDYKITAYSLCSNGQGVCPDTAQSGNNNVEIESGGVRDGVTKVKVRRPLATGDGNFDKDIVLGTDMYIIWALGDVNDRQQVTKHHTRLTGNKQLDFGRAMTSDCEEIKGKEGPAVTAWKAQSINACDETQVFNATMGLTGGDKGYRGITGQISWGIAWYLNGLLIPEVTVLRGRTYTFYVQGGTDATNQARYHPFYITDDPIGGYANKNDEEKRAVKIFAGADANGMNPTVGRYCEYTGNADPLEYDSFGEYKATLTLECDAGNAGSFTWTPDMNTPDLVYYQCFTHNYLGWKIRVVDDCESVPMDDGCTLTSTVGSIVMATIMAFILRLY